MARGFRLLKNRCLFGEVNDNPMRDDIPYPMIYDGGGKRGVNFTIISVTTAVSGHYTGLKVATVMIDTSEDSSLIGESVDVVDHLLCLFNEDDAALVDRKGTAIEEYAISLDAGLPPGTVSPLHFSAKGLCCP